MNVSIAQDPDVDDEFMAELERLREHIHASVVAKGETAEYWCDVLDRNAAAHEANGNTYAADALRRIRADLQQASEMERYREIIWGSVARGEETPEYWCGVLGDAIAEHESDGNILAAAALMDLQETIQADFRDEWQFFQVSRRVAYKRIRLHCRVVRLPRRARARASHRRVGARTTAKASSTGDPDGPSEPPSRRALLAQGGLA